MRLRASGAGHGFEWHVGGALGYFARFRKPYAIALYKYSVGEGDEWLGFLSPKRFKAKIMAEALESGPAQHHRE